MSTDAHVTANLIKTLENGKLGFEKAAEKLESDGRADIASSFRTFAAERAEMSEQLTLIAAAYGDQMDQRSSVPGALHRGWMAVKDAFTGDDPEAVINTAEQGEDHALEQYRDALAADISDELRPVLSQQMATVQRAHDYVRSLVKA